MTPLPYADHPSSAGHGNTQMSERSARFTGSAFFPNETSSKTCACLRASPGHQERVKRAVAALFASTLDLMAFLVLWLRFFDLRFDSGAMISVAAERTEQFDYSSTGADINHVDAGTGHCTAWSGS